MDASPGWLLGSGQVRREQPARRFAAGVPLTLIIHAGGWLARSTGWAALQFVILRSGYDAGPDGGPVAGGSTGPWGCSFHDRRSAACWSGGLREGLDAGERGGDRGGPGPGRGDLEAAAPGAAYQPRGGVQDAVADGLRLGFGEVAVQAQVCEPGEQGGGGQGGGQPRGVDREVV